MENLRLLERQPVLIRLLGDPNESLGAELVSAA
jgi:hypothetical protein